MRQPTEAMKAVDESARRPGRRSRGAGRSRAGRAAVAMFVAGLALAGSVLAAPISGQGTWETTLKARDIGGNPLASLSDASAVFYYDTALNITWLRNWNAGAGSSFDNGSSTTDGRMTWNNAVAWANALTVGTFDDWRLPTVGPSDGAFDYNFSNNGSTDRGYAKTGTGWGTASEYGHMYYVTLGNKGGCTPNDASPGACVTQPGFGPANTAQFSNLRSRVHWSGTEYALNASLAWVFGTDFGDQGLGDKGFELYAVAVRDGDLAPIPEPVSVVLLLAGLGVLGAMARRPR